MAQADFSFMPRGFDDPAAKLEREAIAPTEARYFGSSPNARRISSEIIVGAMTGGVSTLVGGVSSLVHRRQAQKAYDKQVAATDEAVAEQHKRELAAETNAKKQLARARGIEIMYKTGMFDAPKWGN